ncbi:hypothetical protein IPA_00940 [Ignicoccus pacificus DSM 13166]|uniref:Uncharacterized protein n=1 Tax=Ignicoccus pacificus DSM 13166 TaxID=940294 RepID=A0A977PL15_9CREN|nr:hypothetical protein IPA_00940 [Ignicoccus pacificus DSM 13166]
MRVLLVSLALLVTLLASQFTVQWYQAIVQQSPNGVVLQKGAPVVYVRLNEPKIFFLCFNLNGTSAEVTAKLYADVRGTAPSLQDTFHFYLSGTHCVMVPLKPEKATEIQTNELNKIVSEISKGKVNIPKISVVLQNFLGYYVDVTLKTQEGKIIFYRYGYLRVLPASQSCLNVTFKPEKLLPIGSSFNVTITNKCNKEVSFKVAVDMVEAPDMTLKTGSLAPKQSVTYTLSIPNKIGRLALGLTGPLLDYPNGIYVSEVGEKETIVAFLPAYNYYYYFIAPNLWAKYYQGNSEVTKVPSGSSVKGCVYVPNVVPFKEVPTLTGVLEVIQDRSFLPDVTVQKTGFSINELPFTVCTTFTAKGGWAVRGYKLQLNVQGVPAPAKPELGLK